MRIYSAYNVGDKLIHIRHGTDHSFEEIYYITNIYANKVRLAIDVEGGSPAVIPRKMLDDDLNSDYPQFRIERQVEVEKFDDDLFTL